MSEKNTSRIQDYIDKHPTCNEEDVIVSLSPPDTAQLSDNILRIQNCIKKQIQNKVFPENPLEHISFLIDNISDKEQLKRIFFSAARLYFNNVVVRNIEYAMMYAYMFINCDIDKEFSEKIPSLGMLQRTLRSGLESDDHKIFLATVQRIKTYNDLFFWQSTSPEIDKEHKLLIRQCKNQKTGVQEELYIAPIPTIISLDILEWIATNRKIKEEIVDSEDYDQKWKDPIDPPLSTEVKLNKNNYVIAKTYTYQFLEEQKLLKKRREHEKQNLSQLERNNEEQDLYETARNIIWMYCESALLDGHKYSVNQYIEMAEMCLEYNLYNQTVNIANALLSKEGTNRENTKKYIADNLVIIADKLWKYKLKESFQLCKQANTLYTSLQNTDVLTEIAQTAICLWSHAVFDEWGPALEKPIISIEEGAVEEDAIKVLLRINTMKQDVDCLPGKLLQEFLKLSYIHLQDGEINIAIQAMRAWMQRRYIPWLIPAPWNDLVDYLNRYQRQEWKVYLNIVESINIYHQWSKAKGYHEVCLDMWKRFVSHRNDIKSREFLTIATYSNKQLINEHARTLISTLPI